MAIMRYFLPKSISKAYPQIRLKLPFPFLGAVFGEMGEAAEYSAQGAFADEKEEFQRAL